MKTKALFFCFLAYVTLGFKADETPLEKLLKQLAKITASYPQEKVHLHLDKPYYAIGEDIWFKAYVVTAEKNEPSFLSKVLYVELIDEKKEVRKKITLALDKGLANGNLSLTDTLTTGNYRLRAYTNYMRNYDADFFFEKFITIGSILNPTITTNTKEKKSDLDLQFFPEGGNLINGIRSKIGVKAVNQDGLGVNLDGHILNKSNEKVAVFSTEHAGMGIFALVPQLAEKYTAVVTLFNLPQAQETGHSLAVNTVNNQINVRVNSSANLINDTLLNVIAQSNGVVYTSFAIKIEKASVVASIPKNSFPTGIVQFTLFAPDNKPIAERLIFINNNDELKIEVKNNTEFAQIKKKTTLNLTVTDADGNPIDGNFSIAITDASKIPIKEDDETSILSNLLLTSDLKGFIEQPNYYFNAVNLEREKHLDNLLLTQGWRRFIWQEITTGKEPEITHRPEQSLEITGKITTNDYKPLANAKILMFSNTKGFNLMLDTVSNAKGDFVFDRLDAPDSISFIIQSKSGKNSSNNKISISKSPQVNFKKLIGNAVNLNTYLEATKAMFKELRKFDMLDKSILLEQVNIVAKIQPKSALNIPNSANASGAADYVVSADKLKFETNIFTVFSKIPGVVVRNNKITRASTRTVSITQATPSPMVIILDGTRVDQDQISTINPQDIEGIEVLTSNYNTAVYDDGYWGIVHITTKKGSNIITTANTNIVRVKNIGYTPTKQFYVPNYDDPKTNQQIVDLRSTIYWNPNLNSDQKGQANFNFYNASTPGNYNVVIEGIDTFGNLARKVYTYQVK
jgi:hypothetical protein